MFFEAAGGFASSCIQGKSTLVALRLGSAETLNSSLVLELGNLREVLGSSWNEYELGSSLAR